MALLVKTPGVYIEEVPKFPPSVAQVETAIPAFIGYTEKARQVKNDDLHLVPTRIVSLLEYETYFGLAEKETDINVTITEDVDLSGNILSLATQADFGAAGSSVHNMYYSMQLYFGNGGGPCYIISVGKYTDTVFATAFNAVALGDGLKKLAAVDEPTLIVFPEGQHVDSAGNYYALQNESLKQCGDLKDRFALIDLYDNSGDTNTNMTAFRGAGTGIGINNLKYGAAYYPNLVTTILFRFDKSGVDVVHNRTVNGGASAVIAHGTNKLDDSTLVNTVYYAKAVEAIGKMKMVLPPSPAVAGVYATVDSSRGVWKAPANVSLNYVKDVTDGITDEENGVMNIDTTGGKSVNAIRAFTGRGILVWGARTLAGNDNEWRYVPVRRLFNMVEESVKKATVQFVFEPNDANTWTKVRAMISNYLTLIWRQGALAGAKTEHAFYVDCGIGITMTAEDILEGKMIIEIGMAAVRPAEFIVLRFSHKMQES